MTTGYFWVDFWKDSQCLGAIFYPTKAIAHQHAEKLLKEYSTDNSLPKPRFLDYQVPSILVPLAEKELQEKGILEIPIEDLPDSIKN